MADTVYSAAKKLRARRQKVETETSKATREGKSTAKSGPVKKGANYDDAKRSEYTGPSGERAFGAPIARHAAKASKENAEGTKRTTRKNK